MAPQTQPEKYRETIEQKEFYLRDWTTSAHHSQTCQKIAPIPAQMASGRAIP